MDVKKKKSAELGRCLGRKRKKNVRSARLPTFTSRKQLRGFTTGTNWKKRKRRVATRTDPGKRGKRNNNGRSRKERMGLGGRTNAPGV